MALKSSSFQGILNLNHSTPQELDDYLKIKESHTAAKIFAEFFPELNSSDARFEANRLDLPIDFLRLAETLKKMDSLHSTQHLPQRRGLTKRKINIYFWEYLEVLEESATEFFQQIEQAGIEAWNDELANVVKKIMDILSFHLQLLQKTLNFIENQLNDFPINQDHFLKFRLKRILLFWKTNLDPSLFTHAEKCCKYLEFRYQRFLDYFDHYLLFQTKVNKVVSKFERYKIFSRLEPEVNHKFLKIYRLVKFWELNTKTKSLPQREIVKTLRLFILPETTLVYFQSYLHELQKAIYEVSKQIKSQTTIDYHDFLQIQKDLLLGYRNEMHTLGATLAKFRNLLISTDPNPYVRSRIGFADWVMGPEPTYTKQMLNLSYEIETMDSILEGFLESVSRNEAPSESQIEEIKSEILCLLHEMGQPLMSKPMMKLRAEHLINFIEQLDELASVSKALVDFIEQALIKALRGDWKYQVLFNLPKFHKIYTVHQGIISESENKNHLRRKDAFKQLTQQIEKWVLHNDAVKYAHEIELDLHDIKNYLQEFLAEVQNRTQQTLDKAEIQQAIRSIEHQILEYRYLFGNFFYHLQENPAEEKNLRQSFLCVDQYFEAIENKLLEWRSSN